MGPSRIIGTLVRNNCIKQLHTFFKDKLYVSVDTNGTEIRTTVSNKIIFLKSYAHVKKCCKTKMFFFYSKQQQTYQSLYRSGQAFALVVSDTFCADVLEIKDFIWRASQSHLPSFLFVFFAGNSYQPGFFV